MPKLSGLERPIRLEVFVFSPKPSIGPANTLQRAGARR